MKVSRLGENELIRRLSRSIRTDHVVLRGIGDDCAVLAEEPEHLWLFACDMLVEGVHFRRNANPESVGWKALAVNVSDVAAMGGLPRHAVIALGLPPQTRVLDVERLYKGLRKCAGRFGVNLVGGDTNRAPRLVIDVAILGKVERQRVLYRSGAKPGDALFVTGKLGGAVRSGRHLTFTPRLKESRALVSHPGLHAMMDLSDGLAQDLPRLCAASDVAAQVELAAIPKNPGCSIKQALGEGEDFELLIAVAPEQAEALTDWSKRRLTCGLHRIGTVLPKQKGPPVRWIGAAGRPIAAPAPGFTHF